MRLRLFPLNTVLFPGASLRLHIFEERYKEMIAGCLEERAPFGVLLIRTGSEVGGTAEPFEVGTTAHVAGVEHLGEGRMNLLCVGGRRFRVADLVQREPYLAGEVELLEQPEEDESRARELADTAGALFAEYLRLYLAVSNQWARAVEMPSEPSALADFIAARLNTSLWTKQRILEELSPALRLEIETHILGEAIREMTSQVEAVRTARWHGFAVMN